MTRQQRNKTREMKHDLVAAYCDRRGALPEAIRKWSGRLSDTPSLQVAGLLSKLYRLLPEE